MVLQKFGMVHLDYDFSTLGTFTKNSLSEVGIDHYVIDLTGVTNAPSGNFGTQAAAPYGTPKVTGGSGLTATENYVMDTGKLVLQTMELSGTSVTKPKNYICFKCICNCWNWFFLWGCWGI